MVSDDTKIICMNNPNNPTGAVIPEDMLLKIVEIAKKSDAYVLCDEVYRGLNHCGNPFSSSIAAGVVLRAAYRTQKRMR